MLTKIALMFAIHVMVLGVIIGRRMDFVRLSRLRGVFVYLIFFYISWGLIFSLLPDAIIPDIIP